MLASKIQTDEKTVATPQIANSHRGQALTELLISLLGLLIGVGLFFVFVFYTIIHFQIKFELQKSLICLTSESQHYCSQRLKQALIWSHFGVSISEVHLAHRGQMRSANLTLTMRPLLGQRLQRKYSIQTEQL